MLAERTKLFEKSINNRNWRFLIVNTLFGLLFGSYFIFSFVYHHNQVIQLYELKDFTPLIFERYTKMILSYSFLKERIINNNSLTSFYNPKSSFSPKDIDIFYSE